jgi:hypothetical protein
MRAQRALLSPSALAREYTEADISPEFRANGTTDPQEAEYQELAANNFADWRLEGGQASWRARRGGRSRILRSFLSHSRSPDTTVSGRLELYRPVTARRLGWC